MKRDVTVAIPSIPPRAGKLGWAIRSVAEQDHQAQAISIAFDLDRQGAGPTRNRALAGVRTSWTAFLDDDDELLPHHLQVLLDEAEETGADLVWPWFKVHGGTDPFPHHRGRQWDPVDPFIFPITVLARTELLRDIANGEDGPFPAPGGGDWIGDDYPVWRAMAEAGAKFRHVDEVTWTWHHHGANTSGLPGRW